MSRESIKVGAFQFAPSAEPRANLAAIQRGVDEAATRGVRLLLTQECALSGYPPLEIASVDSINFSWQDEAFSAVAELAQSHGMYIALGAVTRLDGITRNSVLMFTPEGPSPTPYHKRALWGWDTDNFTPGTELGIFDVDGLRVGIRICFDVRFPEYFRELFRGQVDLCLVSFADFGGEEQLRKRETMKAHLISRATENVMYVLTANSTTEHQLVPTCIIDPDGHILEEASSGKEHLLVWNVEFAEPTFSQRGRVVHSRSIMGIPD